MTINNVNKVVFCLISSLFPFYSSFQMYILNVGGGYVQSDAGLTQFQLGLLFSVYFYIQLIFLIPAGALLDYLSAKKIILFFMGLLVAGVCLFTFTSSIESLFFSRALMGIAQAVTIIGCFSLILTLFNAEYRPLMMGIVTTMTMVSSLLAQSPFAFLIEKIGWQQTMIVNSVIGIVFLCIMVITFSVFKNDQKSTKKKKDLKSVFKKSQNWIFALYAAVMNLPLIILGSSWGVPYLTKSCQFDVVDASWITGMLFVGAMIGSPLIGAIAKSSTIQKYFIYTALPLLSIPVFIILVFECFALPVFAVLFFLIGLISSTQVLVYPVVTKNNDAIAMTWGFILTLMTGLVALFQSIIGGAVDVFGFRLIPLILFTALILSLLLFKWLRVPD